MKKGNLINVNGGTYEVLKISADEVLLKRTEHPMIEVCGEVINNKIRLEFWRNFHPFTTI
jgi:hypothetical protein